MGALIRPIDTLLPSASSRFGGKARDLATLVRAGFPVPATYALSRDAATRVLQSALPPELSPERLFGAAGPDPDDLSAARARILEADLPREVEGALRQAYRSLTRAAADGLAVRSSSANEDRTSVSGAGVHRSVLNVRSEEALLDAVRGCWASAFAPEVAAYVRGLGLDMACAIGVVVQAMVPADVAGVLFTVNPLTGAGDEMVIDACFGIGTLVTDGNLTPDSYRIDKATGWIRDRVIGDKSLRAVLDPAGGLHCEPVPPSERTAQTLDEHMLERLVTLGRRIEAHFGGPRDIEFALSGDSIYVLQARAVSAQGGRRPGAGRARRKAKPRADPSQMVWSNLNVGEALPGVATPLTWSVLSSFSELGFRKAFGALGCTVPKDARLVGNFRGRIYLNLSELSAIGGQVPGLRPRAVLALGGGGEVERLERQRARGGSGRFLLRLPATVARLGSSHVGFGKKVERFEQYFRAERARIEGIDLRILSSASLDEMLSDVRRLLDETGSLLLTAYGGLLATLMPLRSALGALRGADAELSLQRLLSAIEDVESAHPGREILQLAAAFERDEAARNALLGDAPPRAARELPAGEARRAVESFLARFGHRGVREAELAEPRWRECPRLLFDSVHLQLRHGFSAREHVLAERVREARQVAERELRAVSMPLRPAVRALVSLARHYIRQREGLRSHVVHVLGFLRMVALDASRRMRVREPQLQPDAAFFVTVEELHAWLRGEVRNVAPLTGLRLRQYERDQRLPDPPSAFVGFPGTGETAEVVRDNLSGVAASGGRAEGTVRVLSASSEVSSLQPGEVLVVRAADVGWSPVFVLAAALITELGGPLSHACVVAREYGLPAVVNLPDATRVLRNGDYVRVDGDSGTVAVL